MPISKYNLPTSWAGKLPSVHPTDIEHLEVVQKCLELRKQGYNYRDIGAKVGLSARNAHKNVVKAMDELAQDVAETASQVLQLELARLDEMLVMHLAKARIGDVRSGELVLKIQERRARLLGLDAPIRTDTRVGPLSDMTDAELASEREKLGLQPPAALPYEPLPGEQPAAVLPE